MTDLPLWQSHKIVEAAKIIRTAGDETIQMWILDLPGNVGVNAGGNLLARVPVGADPVGGYYVRYEDVFESWSPAKAFEEGYTRI